MMALNVGIMERLYKNSRTLGVYSKVRLTRLYDHGWL
jgi:hypothetical protein